MIPDRCDVAVIGGGIVGLATAMALAERTRAAVVVLEAEDRLAAHQTGHNSGVDPLGPLLQARLAQGAQLRRGAARRCTASAPEHGIPHERCGKVVVATRRARAAAARRAGAPRPGQRPRRACAASARRRSASASRTLRGVAGLLRARDRHRGLHRGQPRPTPAACARAGGSVVTGARVLPPARPSPATRADLVLETARGALRCGAWSTAPGCSPTASRGCAASSPGVRIVPFRGEYYELVPERAAPGAEPHLPGARPGVPVPRRALHPHGARRRRGRAERGAGARARGLRALRASRRATSPGCSATAGSGGWARSTGAWASPSRGARPARAAFVARAAAAGARAHARPTCAAAAPACGRRRSSPTAALVRRLPHRRGRAHDPRPERAVARGHRVDHHRRTIAERAAERFGLARRDAG